MQTFCVAFPLLPGKAEAGREFAKACMGPRRAEYAESLKAGGVTKESSFLQKTPQGDMLIVYFEAENVERALDTLAKSKTPFAVWFKQQAKSATGFDLEQRMTEPPPEEIVHM